MDLLREKLKCRGGLGACLMGGGGSSSTTGATTNTENNDKRNVVQDGVGVSGDNSSVSTYSSWIDNSNSSDAVIAMANMGADVIKSSGAAVVDLGRFQGEQNTKAWDATLTTGAALIDRLIDKVGDGFTLSSKVVDSFQPAENKNTDAIKWAAIAAGVVGVTALFGKQK